MGNEMIYTSGKSLRDIFPAKKPIIPTLHLCSLPGAPFYRGSSMQELLEVSGVGQVKAERYGAAFLNEIRQYEQTHEEEL